MTCALAYNLRKRGSALRTAMDWRRPTVEYSAAAANPAAFSQGSAERSGFLGSVCATKQILPTITLGMGYLCETTSIEGFVQLLACNFLPHGYWFYVTGWVPEGKDPRQVDAKLIRKYDIDLPRATRSRRKRLGYANLRYLRHGSFFVLIATSGKHRFFEEEAASIRDIRRVPLRFAGYSISYRPGNRTQAGTTDPRWHSHVEIEQQRVSGSAGLVLRFGLPSLGRPNRVGVLPTAVRAVRPRAAANAAAVAACERGQETSRV